MEIMFWVAFGWLAYVYVGYLSVLCLLILFRRVRLVPEESETPSVSVLIAARNEEKDIDWKIRQTLNWNYPANKLQIVVGSDASDDRTDDIVRSIRDPRVTLLRMPERVGKNETLNSIYPHSHGDVLCFTDANSSISPECLRMIVRHFADPRVGCVTGVENNCVEQNAGSLYQGSRAYLGYESMINQLESKIGSVLVCDGSIFAIRRRLFAQLRPELANDLELPLQIGAAGHLIIFEPAARSMERVTLSISEEFRRRRRICSQGALGLWQLRHCLTGIRAWQFFSRKVLRWLCLLPMVVITISSAALVGRQFFAINFAVLALFWLLALSGGMLALGGQQKSMRLFSLPFYFILSNVAACIGVIEALCGRRFRVWDIAHLSRGRGVA